MKYGTYELSIILEYNLFWRHLDCRSENLETTGLEVWKLIVGEELDSALSDAAIVLRRHVSNAA